MRNHDRVGERKLIRVALVTVVLALGVALTGCGATDAITKKATEKAIEKAAESGGNGDVDVDLDSDKGKMTVKSKDGSMSFGANTELPEQFPDDVPLPPGDYTVNMSMANAEHVQATLATTGDVSELADSFRSGLASAGYEVEDISTTTMGEMKVENLSGTAHGKKVVIAVTGGTEDKKVMVTYVIEADDGD